MKSLSSILLCLISFSTWAQKDGSASHLNDVCATHLIAEISQGSRGSCPQPTPCHDPAVREGYDTALVEWKSIEVSLLVIREDDGSNPAATDRQVNMQMHHLNREFKPAKLRFVHSIDYIDDSSIRYLSSTQEQIDVLLDNSQAPSTSCTIIIVGDGPVSFSFYPWTPYGGRGVFINAASQFYPGNHRSSLTHEMGHALGLYHTFTGYNEIPCGTDCSENAGDHSDTTGDFCSDTPPQQLSFAPGFLPTTDTCSQIDFPSIPHTNYLSYSDNKRSFSADQIARMHCYLATHHDVNGWVHDSLSMPFEMTSDSFGYSYNSIEQTSTAWMDISQSGQVVTGLVDDNVVGPFDIGFDFVFYGDTFSQVYVGSNGYIAFEEVLILPFQITNFPNDETAGGAIAPLLTDLFHTASGQGKVYFYSDEQGQVVVSYEHVSFYSNTGPIGDNSFQIVLNNADSAQIRFVYRGMDDYYPQQMWSSPNPSITGILSQDGENGLEVSNYQIPDDLSEIVFHYTPPQPPLGSNNSSFSSQSAPFPNPTSDDVNFQAMAGDALRLFNLNGQLQYQELIQSDGTYQLPLANRSGIYFLQVDREGSIEHHRIVKVVP